MQKETGKPQAAHAEQRLLVLIATPRLTQRAADLFDRGQVPLQYQFLAQGTASSELREVLGLGSSEKSVLLSMMPRPFASAMLQKVHVGLSLGGINSGIAFTVPLSGGSNVLIKMLENMAAQDAGGQLEQEEKAMTECRYSLVMAIVNQGYSEEVMNAARPQGARGGTVFHSRRLVNEEAMKFWGISVQPEKEIVLIVVANEYKRAIMQAISEACGFQSPAHGLVVSLPVDEAIGLKMPGDD